MDQGYKRLLYKVGGMKGARLLWFVIGVCLSSFPGCEKPWAKKTPPLTGSKDFWIDRCDFKYRGKDFPFTGTVADMVNLLGPYDRYVKIGERYFWDSLGLQIDGYKGIGQIRAVDIYFAREESDSEIGYRLADRPEDRIRLAEIRASYPQGLFKGQMVLEGAVIGPVIDFEQVNETRSLYLKTQTGPDAHIQSIRESWSSTRYAFERTCADGRHRRFIFTLISSVPPFRMEALSIGSDNVPDSLLMDETMNRR